MTEPQSAFFYQDKWSYIAQWRTVGTKISEHVSCAQNEYEQVSISYSNIIS